MKTKPFLLAIAIAAVCSTLFFQCKQKTESQDEISRFLTLFSLQVQSKQVDSLVNHFDMPGRKKAVVQLVNLLCGNKGSGDKSKPIFKVELNTTDCDIVKTGDSTNTATFSLKFSRDTNNIEDKTAKLTFKIKKSTNRSLKITDVDAKKFLEDYIAFENVVRQATLKEEDIFSPQTLAAFKVAASLKANYDTIPWFQHINNQTYYFVVKGRFEQWSVTEKDSVNNYKMGLLNPQLKEIIPAQYQLIHNIGATFPNLVEVETADKRGFYNLNGETVLPVEYDQIFPVTDDTNLGVLRQGDNYYWWRKDYSVSESDASIKIEEVLKMVPKVGHNLDIKDGGTNVMELNSRDDHSSIYVAPSYLVDLDLMNCIQAFKNPLRKNIEYYSANKLHQLKFEGENNKGSWLASAFYSVRDYFLDGRYEFYDSKRVILVNNKTNRVYGAEVDAIYNTYESANQNALKGECDINTVTALGDTLYEIKTGTALYVEMHNDDVLTAGPMYHYFTLADRRMEEKRTQRFFAFTKFIKMDESHLNGCYNTEKKGRINILTAEVLRYMKNEIYADYGYEFKDKKWKELFIGRMKGYRYEDDGYKGNADVTDSLTAIDKYNINFIDQKLKALNNKNKVLASK